MSERGQQNRPKQGKHDPDADVRRDTPNHPMLRHELPDRKRCVNFINFCHDAGKYHEKGFQGVQETLRMLPACLPYSLKQFPDSG